MHRREAIHRLGLLLGAAVSAPTAAGLLAGCRAGGGAYRPRALSAGEYGFVGRLAEAVIPETDTPGALQASVDEFIDAMLAGYYPIAEANALRGALPALMERLGDSRQGPDPAALADLDRQAFAASLAARTPGDPFSMLQCYRRLKELIVAGYYTSEVCETNELRPSPKGRFRGDVPLSEIGRSWA